MYTKKGYPGADELVVCKVTKVLPNSVFCNVEEYNRQGMIHISEISPGRIRNIRDFVVEGKIIICKVLNVNEEKGYIDLSLRRVNERQKKEKGNEIKYEQKAMKIIEFAAKELKEDYEKVLAEMIAKILPNYPTVYSCFLSVINDNLNLEKVGIAKKYADVLVPLIKDKIKPPEVEIKGYFKISTYIPDGIEKIKSVLKTTKKIYSKAVIIYLGGGRYHLDIKGTNFKDIEKVLEKITDSVIKGIGHDGTVQFIRSEK